MNHKRGKPKNARAGCLWCKPWKMNHAKEKRPAREQALRTQLTGDVLDRWLRVDPANQLSHDEVRRIFGE